MPYFSFWSLPLFQLRRLEGLKVMAPSNGACVTFWYHMYGAAIGTLSVYTEISGDLGSARWSRTGYTKASRWYEASVNIEPGTEFKVSRMQSGGS